MAIKEIGCIDDNTLKIGLESSDSVIGKKELVFYHSKSHYFPCGLTLFYLNEKQAVRLAKSILEHFNEQ